MSTPTEPPTCEVVALVPSGADEAELLCHTSAPNLDAVQLPTLTLEPEPSLPSVVEGLHGLLGHRVVPLRATATTWLENFDAASMFVEVEPVPGVAPEGFSWLPIDRQTIERLEPDAVRATVGAWLDERTSGWSRLRPQWSRPGFVDEAGRWMRVQMDASGYRDPQPPVVHYLWGASAVLSADSRDGTAYLKCSGDYSRAEPSITRALAERTDPAVCLLPDVVAVEPGRGWLLMRDFGGPILGDRPESEWGSGLEALARLQQSWLGRPEELIALGAKHRTLPELASWTEAVAPSTDMLAALSPDERGSWLAAVPRMAESCHRLDMLGPGPSLVHGDFHPWNVAVRDDGELIFDWTDASLAHPALDLATYVMRAQDVRRRGDLLRAYLDAWARYLSAAERAEVGRLALIVGGLHQVQTYSRLIPTVMPQDLGGLRAGDIGWIRRCMRFAADGLAARY